MEGLDLIQDLAVVTCVAGVTGFICQRIGLSSVVGFLLAGLIIGPNTPPFAYVSDTERIQALSQLGLVFLMFSIGMELSFSKLRRMGIGIFLSVTLSSILVFNIVRSVSQLFGASSTESLFLAGMIMASSSAIIGKILNDTGLVHHRAGNLAMSITVLEDLVAVVVLTFVASFARMQSGPEADLGRILGILLAFVTVIVVLGLLVLPRALKLLNQAGSDLLTITVAGLALGIAVVAVRTGYSLALGAFLLGAIIAETPQRPLVERSMQGMRDVFIAVFFVSIGMLLDPALLAKNWALVLGLGALAIGGRFLAVSVALAITGTPNRDAVRAGLMVTPIGEFAFIIAQLGVTAGLLSQEYYPIAVGAALFTAFVSPFLIQHSAAVSDRLLRLEPPVVRRVLDAYRKLIESALERQRRSQLIAAARRKLPPLIISLVFISGVLIFSPTLNRSIAGAFPDLKANWYEPVFWIALGVFVVVPIIAAWRAFAEFLGVIVEAGGESVSARPILQGTLQLVAAALIIVWLWLLTPVSGATFWFFGSLIISAAALGISWRNRFVTIHHEIGTELYQAILSNEERQQQVREDWLKEHQEWDLHLAEIEVPDSYTWFGKSLGDLALRSQFGCSVVGVDRQGYSVSSPGPDTELYPKDKLLVLGTKTQIAAVRAFFAASEPDSTKADLLDEIRLESIEVPAESRLAGNALAELEIPRHTGVQIAGVARGEYKMLFPGPFQVLMPGDWLLVVGTREQIQHFREWMMGPETQPE